MLGNVLTVMLIESKRKGVTVDSLRQLIIIGCGLIQEEEKKEKESHFNLICNSCGNPLPIKMVSDMMCPESEIAIRVEPCLYCVGDISKLRTETNISQIKITELKNEIESLRNSNNELSENCRRLSRDVAENVRSEYDSLLNRPENDD